MTEKRYVLDIFADLKKTVAELEAAMFPSPPLPPPTPPIPPGAPPPVPITHEAYKIVALNMTPKGDGVYRSTNLGKDQKCNVQARLLKPALPGQTVVFVYEQETNVEIDGTKNIKDSRNYPNASTGYPNDYSGRSLKTGSHQVAAENGDGVVLYQKAHPEGWTVGYYTMPLILGKKQIIKREFRYSSAKNKPDGWARITVDGKKVFEAEGWICNGPRGDFGAQMVCANPGTMGALPGGAYYAAKIISLEVIR